MSIYQKFISEYVKMLLAVNHPRVSWGDHQPGKEIIESLLQCQIQSALEILCLARVNVVLELLHACGHREIWAGSADVGAPSIGSKIVLGAFPGHHIPLDREVERNDKRRVDMKANHKPAIVLFGKQLKDTVTESIQSGEQIVFNHKGTYPHRIGETL